MKLLEAFDFWNKNIMHRVSSVRPYYVICIHLFMYRYKIQFYRWYMNCNMQRTYNQPLCNSKSSDQTTHSPSLVRYFAASTQLMNQGEPGFVKELCSYCSWSRSWKMLLHPVPCLDLFIIWKQKDWNKSYRLLFQILLLSNNK